MTAGVASLALAQPTAVVLGPPEAAVEGVDPGEVLLGGLNCIACHSAGPDVQARLASKPAPLLGEVGARVTPQYLRAWLANPHAEKPGSSMPDLLHGLGQAERNQTVDHLVHYLASLGKPSRAAPTPVNQLLIRQGRVLYHQVGCVACHPPEEPAAVLFPDAPGGSATDPEAARFILAKLSQTSVPLGKLAARFTVEQLIRFLLDPLAVRPGGRMPSLSLKESEAMAMAMYLLREQVPPLPALAAKTEDGPVSAPASLGPVMTPLGVGPFVIDRSKARRGKELFASLGCAACHQVGKGQLAVASRLRAKALAELTPDQPGGCLSASPSPAAPRYHLDESQRAALRATLAAREKLLQPLTARERVNRTLAVMNCLACHSRDGVGGPGPSRSDYFTVLVPVDLGDEGRLPPHLTGVGLKLRPDWLREVLLNKGAVRPYMATRMPQYGQPNVERLIADFEAADAADPPAPAGTLPPANAEVGRELVGVTGYSCISCHNFAQHASLGISVMDLTHMARRLQPDWFRRYLAEPASLRPGTRMPTFWPEGQGTNQTILGGDPDRQIAAIWSYLQLGARAKLPPGLPQGATNTPTAKP
jgi:mono/diheme cytochrome c family protein